MQVLYLSRYKLWQYFDFQHLGRGASSAIFNTWHSSNQIINSPSVWLPMHDGNPQTLAVMCEIPLQILWGGGGGGGGGGTMTASVPLYYDGISKEWLL